MSQDHYVAQTYLRAFVDQATVNASKKGGKIHAYRKSDCGYFTPFPNSVCKTLDWDRTDKYLTPPDALGQWLKMFEPHWAAAVERLSRNHHLSPVDKLVIAAYWAYLSTCTPTWQRVVTGMQQAELEQTHLEKFIEYALARPEKFPEAKHYISLVKNGMLKPRIDKNFPKAIVTAQLPKHHWLLYHQEWNVIYNQTDELFLTSDNPSCFDYEYGTEIRPARYVPLTPRLALWTDLQLRDIPQMKPTADPLRKSVGCEATVNFVKIMNRQIIQCAENLVLSSEKNDSIEVSVRQISKLVGLESYELYFAYRRWAF